MSVRSLIWQSHGLPQCCALSGITWWRGKRRGTSWLPTSAGGQSCNIKCCRQSRPPALQAHLPHLCSPIQRLPAVCVSCVHGHGSCSCHMTVYASGLLPRCCRNLRILAAGGDGTVTWILKTIQELQLDPPPAVAVMPLGTGNDLSLSFGWGNAFLDRWIAAPQVGAAVCDQLGVHTGEAARCNQQFPGSLQGATAESVA